MAIGIAYAYAVIRWAFTALKHRTIAFYILSAKLAVNARNTPDSHPQIAIARGFVRSGSKASLSIFPNQTVEARND